jgi:polyphosphate kinase 2 (PPK2 family)
LAQHPVEIAGPGLVLELRPAGLFRLRGPTEREGAWVQIRLVHGARLRRDRALVRFEQARADGGTVIVKLYFHLPRREYKKRLKQLEKKPKKGGWRVREEDLLEQLTESGMVLCKFWLHIDAEEQIRRFKAREKTAFKKYKITEEDYRNREKCSA